MKLVKKLSEEYILDNKNEFCKRPDILEIAKKAYEAGYRKGCDDCQNDLNSALNYGPKNLNMLSFLSFLPDREVPIKIIY